MKTERLVKEFVYSREDKLHKEHFHNDYQLIFVVSGSVEVVCDGKEFIAGPNSLVFISNLENHSIKILQSPYERYYMTLPVRELEETVLDSQLLSIFKNRPVSFCNVFNVAPIADEISCILKLLHVEVNRTPNEYTQRYISHLITVLILSIYRNSKK